MPGKLPERTHVPLRCFIRALRYNFQTRYCFLHFPERNNCDTTAAIELATTLDPECQVIKIFAGDKPAMRYERQASGEWIAIVPDEGQ
jgi:hypothetical protein